MLLGSWRTTVTLVNLFTNLLKHWNRWETGWWHSLDGSSCPRDYWTLPCGGCSVVGIDVRHSDPNTVSTLTAPQFMVTPSGTCPPPVHLLRVLTLEKSRCWAHFKDLCLITSGYTPLDSSPACQLDFYPLFRRNQIFNHTVLSLHSALYKLYTISPQLLVLDLLRQSFHNVKIYFLSLLNLMVIAFKILYFRYICKSLQKSSRAKILFCSLFVL